LSGLASPLRSVSDNHVQTISEEAISPGLQGVSVSRQAQILFVIAVWAKSDRTDWIT